VVSAVVHDKFGIGYGGIAWDKGVRAVPVRKDDKTTAVEPTLAAITDGTYRSLASCTGSPAGPRPETSKRS